MFVQHMIATLKDNGRMAVVMPQPSYKAIIICGIAYLIILAYPMYVLYKKIKNDRKNDRSI